MSENKRYANITKEDILIVVKNNKNEKVIVDEDIIDELNDLADENEHLKQQLRIYSDGLKAEIRETKEVFEDYSECVDEKKQLKEENEELKSFIKSLASSDGRIWLDNGYCYRISKILKGDFE